MKEFLTALIIVVLFMIGAHAIIHISSIIFTIIGIISIGYGTYLLYKSTKDYFIWLYNKLKTEISIYVEIVFENLGKKLN